MELKIKPETIQVLTEAGFYPDTMFNALFAMSALYHKEYKLLDCWDDASSSRRAVLTYYDLVRKGLWADDETSPVLYKFTDHGKEFIEHLLITEIRPTSLIEEWFPKWFELWPKGVRTMGKLVRSDEKGCLEKMKKFIKEYPNYQPELIIRATATYLQGKERDDWKGVRSASNFISLKGSGSDLAAECEDLKDKGEERHYETPTTNYFI
jgi:hypothetical protein